MLLALTCERVLPMDEHLVQMVMTGDAHVALRIGLERIERSSASLDPLHVAATGQLLGRVMLANSRAEDAEEFFQRMPRTYEAISRSAVRWFSSLDQAEMAMHLRRWGRAAEAWHLVADDAACPAALRVEATAGLAESLYMLGEHRHAAHTLSEARRIAQESGETRLLRALGVLDAELAARSRLDTFETLSDYALHVIDARHEGDSASALCETLRAHASGYEAWPVVAHTLEALGLLLADGVASTIGRAQLASLMRWFADHGYARMEATLRMNMVLSALARDDAGSAADTLSALQHPDRQPARERHALDLLYCNSRLLSIHGRHGEALHAYKKYVRESMYHTARERAHLPRIRFLERKVMAEEGDAAMLRLPLRYRRAYRFIMERLADSELSIRDVAAHIAVTERALQMTFRRYLGVTPAELIRHRRMQGIRDDLCDGTGGTSVLKTAERWGMSNRSTLAHGYRQMFSETPTHTLRGSGRGE